jgi:hypothetical protein
MNRRDVIRGLAFVAAALLAVVLYVGWRQGHLLAGAVAATADAVCLRGFAGARFALDGELARHGVLALVL